MREPIIVLKEAKMPEFVLSSGSTSPAVLTQTDLLQSKDVIRGRV